jgi:6-phosphofructokinase 1
MLFAVAGYTGFSVGLVNNRLCYLPIPLLVATSPRSLNPYGQTWERILTMTGQPNTVPQIKMTKYSIPTTETEESVNQFPKLPDPPMH